MTDALANRVAGFARCAVCKIDLKGRFVYIDDDFERLVGATKEEMFGCGVEEFLDETSQSLIRDLLSERNHYETFYEATYLVLIRPDGGRVTVRCVASLNFIAGNPANFQLVLDQLGEESGAEARPTALAPLGDFLGRLLSVDRQADFRHYLGHWRRFAAASQAAVYVIGDDGLELRSASSDDTSADFAYTAIPDTTALHERVARSGEGERNGGIRAVEQGSRRSGEGGDAGMGRWGDEKRERERGAA